MGARKYEVEIVVTNDVDRRRVDTVLASLASEGIYVHSNRETDTTTGKRLAALPGLTFLYAATRKGA